MLINLDGISIAMQADLASKSQVVSLLKDGQQVYSTVKDADACDVLGKENVFAFAAQQLFKRLVHDTLKIAQPVEVEEAKAEEA